MQPDSRKTEPDLGDLVIVLLGGTLAGLADGLRAEGFEEASGFVAELGDRCDAFVEERKQ